jgi:hypothetical protein
VTTPWPHQLPSRARWSTRWLYFTAVAFSITLLPATEVSAQPIEARLERIEQQMQDIVRRLHALEHGTSQASLTRPESNIPTGPTWTFRPPLDGSEIRVLHYGLSTETGIIDLLARIEAPLTDRADWGRTGTEVPIRAEVDDGGDAPAAATFTLVRGASLEPGASLHLQARIPVARAAKAGEIRIDLQPSLSPPAAN